MVCFHSNRLHHLMARNKNAQNICFSYTVTVVHFTDQNWISKTVYCIRCVMDCKIVFTNWNAKIELLRASMVVTYYIKLFRTGANRYNGILMSLLLLVAETIIRKGEYIKCEKSILLQNSWIINFLRLTSLLPWNWFQNVSF